MTSTSIGQLLLQFSHWIHSLPVGRFLMSENRDGTFITSETGQSILQNALLSTK